VDVANHVNFVNFRFIILILDFNWWLELTNGITAAFEIREARSVVQDPELRERVIHQRRSNAIRTAKTVEEDRRSEFGAWLEGASSF
jgi:predicted transposase YbfD/YdcC